MIFGALASVGLASGLIDENQLNLSLLDDAKQPWSMQKTAFQLSLHVRK